MAVHLRARAALGKAIPALEAAGVPTLIVKGAVLAYALYRSPLDRPIRDVDLRVAPEHLARAESTLVAMGAKRLVSSRVYQSVVVRFEGAEIDVEATVGPPFVCAVGVEAMLRRAERTDAGLGFSHRRPELHDHALLLAINLFKDRLDEVDAWRLRDSQLIAEQPAFDVDALAARAAEARCTTLVHVVARHVARACDSEAWSRVASRVVPARARYASRVLRSLEDARERRGARLALWRALVRASSDDRARAAAAVLASAARELETAPARLAVRKARRARANQ